MKKAYTIDQQIARLKSNGMMFDNEEKAKEILLDVGYYRLGFYSFPYEIKFPRLEHRDHKLKSGTTFKSVYDFYENPIIQHHHANHSGIYAPAWKTIEFMTIGNIITLYDSLKEPAAKDLVANAYGCSKGVFFNYLETIRVLRNKCAHGGCIYRMDFPKGIKRLPADISADCRHNIKVA